MTSSAPAKHRQGATLDRVVYVIPPQCELRLVLRGTVPPSMMSTPFLTILKALPLPNHIASLVTSHSLSSSSNSGSHNNNTTAAMEPYQVLIQYLKLTVGDNGMVPCGVCFRVLPLDGGEDGGSGTSSMAPSSSIRDFDAESFGVKLQPHLAYTCFAEGGTTKTLSVVSTSGCRVELENATWSGKYMSVVVPSSSSPTPATLTSSSSSTRVVNQDYVETTLSLDADAAGSPAASEGPQGRLVHQALQQAATTHPQAFSHLSSASLMNRLLVPPKAGFYGTAYEDLKRDYELGLGLDVDAKSMKLLRQQYAQEAHRYVQQVMWNGAIVSPSGQKYWKSILAVHHFLNDKRTQARSGAPPDPTTTSDGTSLDAPQRDSGDGPRIVVCSAASGSGKSTVCRILSNYAVRSGYNPLVLNLDPTMPSHPGNAAMCGLPGSMSATSVQDVFDVQEGASFVPMMSFWFGSTANPMSSASESSIERPTNTTNSTAGGGGGGGSAGMGPSGASMGPDATLRQCYRYAVKNMIETAEGRLLRYDRCKFGGVIVDTPTVDCEDPEAVDVLRYIVEQVGADVVLFVGGSGAERLRHELRLSFVRVANMAAAAVEAATGRRPKVPNVFDTASNSIRSRSGQLISLWCLSSGLPSDGSGGGGGSGGIFALQSDASSPFFSIDRGISYRCAWRQYFFGTTTSPLSPTALDLDVSTLRVVMLKAISKQALDGLLPMEVGTTSNKRGAEEGEEDGEVVFSDIRLDDVDLRHRIVALSSAVPEISSAEDEHGGTSASEVRYVTDTQLRDHPVLMYLWVWGFKPDGKLMTLAPRDDVVVEPGMAILVPMATSASAAFSSGTMMSLLGLDPTDGLALKPATAT